MLFTYGSNIQTANALDDVIDAAADRGVRVYAVAFGDEIDTTPLLDITSLTGGALFSADALDGLDGAINRIVADIIANVQTGTGNRIEFWDNEGMPFKSKGKIRRYIDVGRLTRGR